MIDEIEKKISDLESVNDSLILTALSENKNFLAAMKNLLTESSKIENVEKSSYMSIQLLNILISVKDRISQLQQQLLSRKVQIESLKSLLPEESPEEDKDDTETKDEGTEEESKKKLEKLV